MEALTLYPTTGPLVHPDHEAFAQAVATGTPAAIAYREHCSPVSNKTSWEQASRLMRKAGARIQYLREEAARGALDNYGIDASTLVRLHLEIVTTPIGEIDEHHHLCQKIKRKRKAVQSGDSEEVWITEEVAMPSKTASLEALAEMTGLNVPQKKPPVHPSGGGMAAITSNPPMLYQFGRLMREFPESAKALRAGLDSED